MLSSSSTFRSWQHFCQRFGTADHDTDKESDGYKELLLWMYFCIHFTTCDTLHWSSNVIILTKTAHIVCWGLQTCLNPLCIYGNFEGLAFQWDQSGHGLVYYINPIITYLQTVYCRPVSAFYSFSATSVAFQAIQSGHVLDHHMLNIIGKLTMHIIRMWKCQIVS